MAAETPDAPAPAPPPPRGALQTLAIAVLWTAVAGLLLLGLVMLTGGLDVAGSDPAGRGMSAGFGCIVTVIGAAAGGAMLLALRWRAWLFVAAAIIVTPLLLTGFWWLSIVRSDISARQLASDMRSGKADFGNQPALLALANAISQNDPEAMRAAATNVPDLQAPGEDGKTLLYFAVDQALERPELIRAVEALLSLGADPNFNNGSVNSFAMWRAMHGPVRLLEVMLDHGGDPNGLDFRGNPIILENWSLTFNEQDRAARFRLLLDRGADVNTAYPPTSPMHPGYSLLLARVNTGRGDFSAYTDAIELLERGADPKHAAVDGMNLVRMLQEHRQFFAETQEAPPPEFEALWEWLRARDLLPRD